MGQGTAGQTLSRAQLCKILGEEGLGKRPREKRVASSQQGPQLLNPHHCSQNPSELGYNQRILQHIRQTTVSTATVHLAAPQGGPRPSQVE